MGQSTLGVSRDQLEQAIGKVGNSAAAARKEWGIIRAWRSMLTTSQSTAAPGRFSPTTVRQQMRLPVRVIRVELACPRHDMTVRRSLKNQSLLVDHLGRTYV